MSRNIEMAELLDGDVMPIEMTFFYFRDKVFKSRTFVFADGSTAPVENSLIIASTQEHVTYLDRHADFERIDGSA